MLVVVQRNLSVLLLAMEKSCTTRTALVLAWWLLSELFAYVLLRLIFEGGVYLKKYCILITMAFVKLFCCCNCYCLPRTSPLERWSQELFAFLFDQNTFCVWIHCSTWSNLTHIIQFLEFMGGSNSTHAHSNYVICMRIIRRNIVSENYLFDTWG